MQDFRNLKIWQRAHALVLVTYRITADFPRDEIFGLRHSMRKASVDIAAYIAEGSSRPTDAEFAAAIGAAVAVAAKLEYYALVANDLRFIEESTYEQYAKDIIEVKKMMNGFKRSLT